MSVRAFFDMSMARIICSKQGFDASPSLPDVNKSFDSNWYSGNGIKWILSGSRGDDGKLRFYYPVTLNYIPGSICCQLYHDTSWLGNYYNSVPESAYRAMVGSISGTSTTSMWTSHNNVGGTNPQVPFITWRLLVFENV